MCCSQDSLKIVQNRCEGRLSCTLEANNFIFGDPCPNTYKYLEMEFQCVQGLDSEDLIPSSPVCVQIISSSTSTGVPSPTPKSTIRSMLETTTTDKGVIIGIVFGSLVFILSVSLLGYINRSRFMQKTEKEGNSNIYTDLDKKDQVINSNSKTYPEGPSYTQEYSTLNHVAVTTNHQTEMAFSNSIEYLVYEPSNSSNKQTVATNDTSIDNGAYYANLDPLEIGIDVRTNQENKQLHEPNEYLELIM